MKTQLIRLIDVFLIGPFLIHGGLRPRHLTRNEKMLLALIGAATVLYNLKNYLETRQQEFAPSRAPV